MVDWLLLLLVVSLVDLVVGGLALKLTTSHQLHVPHLRALGWDGVVVLAEVAMVGCFVKRWALGGLVCCLLLPFTAITTPNHNRLILLFVKIRPIQRLIIRNCILLITQIILPLQLQMIHQILIDLMELIVIGSAGCFGWNFMVIFGRFRNIGDGNCFIE